MNILASKGQLRASFIRWSLLIVPAMLLLGFLSGEIAGSPDSAWFRSLEKPTIFPPSATFGLVWACLWVVTGLALALICAAWGARGRRMAITLFLLQFVVSLAWTPVFFGAYQMTGGLVLLVIVFALAVATTIAFWKIRRLAAYLMLPYLAWILFATVLNYQFLSLNPEADGVEAGGAVQRMEL